MNNQSIEEGLNRSECFSAASEESNPLTAPNCFPDELIREILLRLPAKSLLKFRCVSKSWLSLISSSQFARAHVKISSRNKSSTHHRIIARYYSKYTGEEGIVDFPLKPLLNELKIDPVNLDDQIDSYFSDSDSCDGYSYFSDSCDGLILFQTTRNNFILWNPSLRKAKNLRASKLTNRSLMMCACGISYDDSSDDYKLVVFVDKFNKNGHREAYGGYQVEVFSLKTRSWRKIGDFNGVRQRSRLVKGNGKLHWLDEAENGAHAGGAAISLNIAFLDFATEAFGVMERPPYELGERFNRSYYGENGIEGPELQVLSGQLCVYYSSPRNLGHVWAMKEYGVQESWTELVTISFDTIGGLCLRLKPIHIFENGDILLYSGCHLAVYNPKNKMFRFPQIDNLIHSRGDAAMYVESLVFPG